MHLSLNETLYLACAMCFGMTTGYLATEAPVIALLLLAAFVTHSWFLRLACRDFYLGHDQ